MTDGQALLHDVFDLDLFNDMVEKKYVKVQTHPEYPNLRIANYTEPTTWERMWNEVTMRCRGLIYDAETLEVYARPFSKFFNNEEPCAPEFSPEDSFDVYDKMDGSLGILYPTPDGYAIATRGSFMSDQAQWATGFFRTRHSEWEPNPAWTYCFEIIYPENRIVVDYGDRCSLVFLGAVDKETGASVEHYRAIASLPENMEQARWFMRATLSEILAHMEVPEDNFEGFVLHHFASDTRIKIKYEQYKILHRFMTNTTEKHVWEVIVSGQSPEIVFAAAPDEFHEWLQELITKFYTDQKDIYLSTYLACESIRGRLPREYTRKDFALAVKAANPLFPSLLFLFEDDDEAKIQNFIWQQLKPKGSMTMRLVSNDAN
jgi:RNA ligase